MKLAFINQPWDASVPPESSLSIWTYEVTRRLAADDEIVVYGRSRTNEYKSETLDGVEYRHMPGSPLTARHRLISRWSRWMEASRPEFARSSYHRPYMESVARDIARIGADCVFFFNFCQFAPIIRRFNPQARIILDMQCEWLTQLDASLVTRCLRDVDLVVGCSDYITSTVKNAFPAEAHRCRTIDNGVDIERFQNGMANEATASGNGERHVLFVGRVSPEKALHVVLDAFAKAAEAVPEARLNLVGPNAQCPAEYIVGVSRDPRVAELARFYDGRPYVEHLKEQARRLGIADRVRFVGPVAHAELNRFYAEADVLVNPSFSESFGMALIEAMVSGVPVVASRVGGMTDIVEHEATGLLVEPGDAEGLAEAMIRMLQDVSLRDTVLGPAHARASTRFRWERIAGNLRTACRAMLNGGPGAD